MHEDLATRSEATLRRLLQTENYDSVSNLLTLYDTFGKQEQPLYELYESYAPPIRAKKHTCVGLGLELMRRWRVLEKDFPGFISATALLSCEEAVQDVREYVCGEGPEDVTEAEKEHVMVGVQIQVDGRPGLLLADPGYHVPRIITVMADRAYPHTAGWFTQSDEPECRKEYNYTYSPQNSSYVEWHEKQTRGNIVKCHTSLVYAARPYMDGVNVTERRNLVYDFRSLLSRDQKGHLVAGIYFPVKARAKDTQFTLFFDSGSEKVKAKYKFSTFMDPDNIPETLAEAIEICNTQLNYKSGELFSIICRLANMLSDHSFIDQMLEINDDICRMCL